MTDPIATAKGLHRDYGTALQEWRQFREDPSSHGGSGKQFEYNFREADLDFLESDSIDGTELFSLWHTVTNAYRASMLTGHIDPASILENLGLDQNTRSILGVTPEDGLYALLSAYENSGVFNKWLELTLATINKRTAVEEAANKLIDFLVTGNDPRTDESYSPLYLGQTPSSLEEDQRAGNPFYDEFTDLSYTSRLALAVTLTDELAMTQRGKEFLASQFYKPQKAVFDPFSLTDPESSYLRPDGSFVISAWKPARDIEKASVVENLAWFATNVYPGLQCYKERAASGFYEQIDPDNYSLLETAKIDNVDVAGTTPNYDASTETNDYDAYKVVVAQFMVQITALFISSYDIERMNRAIHWDELPFESSTEVPSLALSNSSAQEDIRTATTITKHMAGGLDGFLDKFGPTGTEVSKSVLKPVAFATGLVSIISATTLLGEDMDGLDVKIAVKEIAGGLGTIAETITGSHSSLLRKYKEGKISLRAFARMKTLLVVLRGLGAAASISASIGSGITAFQEYQQGDYDAMAGHIMMGVGSGLAAAATLAFIETGPPGWVAGAVASIVLGGFYIVHVVDEWDGAEWMADTYFGKHWASHDTTDYVNGAYDQFNYVHVQVNDNVDKDEESGKLEDDDLSEGRIDFVRQGQRFNILSDVIADVEVVVDPDSDELRIWLAAPWGSDRIKKYLRGTVFVRPVAFSTGTSYVSMDSDEYLHRYRIEDSTEYRHEQVMNMSISSDIPEFAVGLEWQIETDGDEIFGWELSHLADGDYWHYVEVFVVSQAVARVLVENDEVSRVARVREASRYTCGIGESW